MTDDNHLERRETSKGQARARRSSRRRFRRWARSSPVWFLLQCGLLVGLAIVAQLAARWYVAEGLSMRAF